MARFATQAGATAGRAGLGAQVFAQFFTHTLRFGLAVASLQVRHYAFKGVIAHDDVTAIIQIAERHFFRAGAVQHQLAMLVIQLAERNLQRYAVMISQ